MSHSHPDLFAPPLADLARPIGTIEGPPGWHEGFGAGLRVWCGPHHGWRDFGELIAPHGPATILSQWGRMSVGLAWDLGPGPARPIRPALEDEADG